MPEILSYVAAAMIGLWGIAHAVPTAKVIRGFEPITADNRRIVLQEWLAEAFTMGGIALLLVAVTAASGSHAVAAQWTYRVVAGLLVALATLTGLTGAKTPVVWFKICPVLLTSSAIMLLVASVA